MHLLSNVYAERQDDDDEDVDVKVAQMYVFLRQ
jgi:hypothetical protein